MRQIVLLSLAVVPLVAGCAATHGPEVEAERAAAVQTSSDIASLRARISKLNRRVRTLGRRVSEQASYVPVAEPSRTETVVVAEPHEHASDAQLASLKRRLAGLETRVAAAPSQAAPVTTINGDQANDIAALQDRLKALEAKQRSAGRGSDSKGDPALSKRLARAEAKITAFAKKHGTMEKELDRDRSLVVDYLEDLDNRLESLEKSSGASNTPPSPTPKSKP